MSHRAFPSFNEKLIQLIDQKLAADRAFEYNEVSVNLAIDGGIVYCWARQPNKGKMRRFERLIQEAREELAEQEDRPAEPGRRVQDASRGETAPSEAASP